MIRLRIVFAAVSLAAAAIAAQEPLPAPRVYGEVTVNATHIAFVFGGQIWDVPRQGGTARRLTTSPEDHAWPLYSPDGMRLAFTRGTSLYVMPAGGGEPTRLTWFPRTPFPRAWSPDGRTVLYTAARDGDGNMRAILVPAGGGPETMLPLNPVRFASYAPDGRRLAVVARTAFAGGVDRRFYRGGMRDPIEIVDPRTGAGTPITDGTANAIWPMWIGRRIYYATDALGSFNLAVYDTATRAARRLTNWRSHGLTAAGAGGGAIAFVRDGRIHLLDLATERITVPPIDIPADSAELAPRTVPVARFVGGVSAGPRGERVAVETRGDVIVLDVATGQVRNLTATPGAAERQPVISPDGRLMACFTDVSGEYALQIRPTDGTEPVGTIALGDSPTYFRGVSWSPDGRRVAFSDQRLALWVADVERGRAEVVDTSRWIAQGLWQTSWSPDGRLLAYAKADSKGTRAVWVRDLAQNRAWKISHGGSDDTWPVFDPTGRWLYFASSSLSGNAPAREVWSLLSSSLAEPQISHRLVVTSLRADDGLPVLPFGMGPNPAANSATTGPLDLAGAASRIAMLPAPARFVLQLWMTPRGDLLAQVLTWGKVPLADEPTSEMLRYDPRENKVVALADGLRGADVSADGGTIVLARRDGWALLPADATAADAKAIDLSKAAVRVEPRAEWAQIFHEAMRMMRDYFYDPGHHGVEMADLERHYAAYLPGLTRRADLNTLLVRAFGEISISHLQVAGGDIPRAAAPSERTGVLGADLEIAEGHYRFARVLRNGPYQSENILTRAPLDQPGAQVRDGEYLFEVDGAAVTTDRPAEFFLVGKGGRPTRLRVGPNADGAGARDVTVVPSAGDNGLRRANWAEANRREVERRSNGRLAYVYIDGWSLEGVSTLMRAINGNSTAQGLIIDQRWNGGGITADEAIDALTRTPLYAYLYRYGDGFEVPQHLVGGPKVLLVHESNGSAAETFALMFQERKVGPIVGRTTAGGGIGGALYYQPMIDGGRVVIPLRASYNTRLGVWGIENRGVVPDIRVSISQADAVAGRDPQLQRAIDAALLALKSYRPAIARRPAMPVHPRR